MTLSDPDLPAIREAAALRSAMAGLPESERGNTIADELAQVGMNNDVLIEFDIRELPGSANLAKGCCACVCLCACLGSAVYVPAEPAY